MARMKVSVEKGRKQILVLRWGGAPFGYEDTRRGLAVVPHGFVAETYSDKTTWIASTRVVDGGPEYKFTLRASADTSSELGTSDQNVVESDWKRNPTAAYGQANERAKNKHFRKGTNAAIIIGCTYPSLQKEILTRFDEDIPLSIKQRQLAANHDSDCNSKRVKQKCDQQFLQLVPHKDANNSSPIGSPVNSTTAVKTRHYLFGDGYDDDYFDALFEDLTPVDMTPADAA